MSDNESSSDESIEPQSQNETTVEVIEEEDYDYLVKQKHKEIYKDDREV